jgi:tetratricopeptide (TPR) repeat protein
MSNFFTDMNRRNREERTKEIAAGRPSSETDLQKRPDRIKKYLLPVLDGFVFDEFSDAYLKKTGFSTELTSVPVPLRQEDVAAFLRDKPSKDKSNKGLSLQLIGENMVRVIGVDPRFRHAEAYKAFLYKILDKKAPEYVCRKAKDAADKENYDDACILFRAGLVLKPDDLASMYGYAKVCRAMYNKSGDANYVGNFKAESLEYFELLTEIHPKFASGWYYLGYMYLNLGLYTKAHLAWERFIPLSRIAKDRREINQRMDQIATPMEIERGYNAVLTGRFELGIEILEPFTNSVYNDWWPLWYYLGEAYAAFGRSADAAEAFTKVLRFNASHIETMEALVELYTVEGRDDMIDKYEKKIEIVRKQLENSGEEEQTGGKDE